jgi:integrase
MAGRRRFGKVRKLPSGRYQASYLDPDGVRRPAPETYRTKREAEQWLSVVEAELLRGQWTNPEDRRELLRDFGNRWISERPGLRPRTLDLYRWTFKKHIEPFLGKAPLGEIDAARVRAWRARLLASGVSRTMTAKAYRLLRAILMTAVDDGVLTRNPCRITGAGSEPTPERPALTVTQVFDLAEKVPRRYTILVLVAAFGSLRWSEATALRRRDVSIKSGVVRVERAQVERSSGELSVGPPKSRAGTRAVALPRPVVLLLATHLEDNVNQDPEALIFTGDKGAALRRSNFNRQANWKDSVAAIGMPGLHFHDLRHTGNTMASDSGASLRDLMARMGHDSMQAALIYQHRSKGADRRIAAAMEALIEAKDEEDPDDEDPDDGASGALVRNS